VEQVTTIDPRPVTDDAHSPDDPDTGFRNWTVPLYDNVMFADNYYQRNDLTFPYGDFVRGARNFDLTNNVSGVGNRSHTNTHVYYHGTVERGAQDDGNGYDVVDSWYATAGQNRATTGYA
jgi:hypothetical protein